MKALIPFLAAGALAFTAATSFAQAPATDGGKPRLTPEQREKMREAYKAAREACKDSPDRRACVTDRMCAQASDPARCQARAKERHVHMSQRMDERQAAHEACTGKRGDELMKCLGEQHRKK